MSKFLPERKKLLEEVYEKASGETPETSFSGIAKYLERVLLDDYQITLSYKSFETYYKSIVDKEEDYNIKTIILDDLSRYLGYDSFRDYHSGWKSFEHKVNQAISKIVITVINKPLLTMPEFMTKKSSIGIAGVLVMMIFFTGNSLLSNEKGEKGISNISLGFFGSAKEEKKKECMYWGGDEYKLTYCDDKNPKHSDLKPIDTVLLRHFKRINRPDTLTVENAMGIVWYDKSDNNVEFFNNYGRHPENGKALKDVTPRILDIYAGIGSE